MIFYLTTRSYWETVSGACIAEPSEGEQFVHCCDERQIAGVRRRYLPINEEVVALAFDPTQLPVETRYEPGTGGEPERFPHVYGPLQRGFVAFARDV